MIVSTYLKGSFLYGGDFEKTKIPQNRVAVNEKYNHDKIIPKYDIENLEWIDIASQEEISQTQLANQKENEKQAYIKRAQDGQEAYAAISAEFRLAKLSGVITEEAHAFIEKLLIPVRNEVLAGQWMSAKKELELLGSQQVGEDLYNRLNLQISNYISENY